MSEPGSRRRVVGTTGRALILADATHLMGVLNVTPDSFSDGGRDTDVDAAVERCVAMVEAGASIVDIGAESTRPGYTPVPASEQLRRLLPTLQRLRARVDVPISVDTTDAEVADVALRSGADWVNDTSALAHDPAMAAVVARHRCPVVLMHRFEPTRTDGDADVVPAVVTALRGAIDRAIGAGIARDAILVDPGLGFGTTAFDCARLIAHVAALRSLGVPILVGPSRKSFLGRFTGRPVDARLPGTAAAVAALALARVEVIRVHDVAEMRDVVKVIDAIHAAGAAPLNR